MGCTTETFSHLYPPCIEFNLGPLRLLFNLSEKIYNLRPVEYIYRKTSTGSLAKRLTRLRRVVELQAHRPTKLWSL